MPLNLLPGVAEKWAPAIACLNEEEKFPISGPEALQKILRSTPQVGGTISMRFESRSFFIDLVEVSPSNVGIVALSVIKFSTIGTPRMLGGTVITERYAGHPKAADHRELILGMEVLTIQPYGTISARCCREDWMAGRGLGRFPTARAQSLRQRIIRIATERMLRANATAREELNAELDALYKKVSTFLASKDNFKLLDVEEQITTKKAISSIGKAIDDLHHLAAADAVNQARGDHQSKEANAPAKMNDEQHIPPAQHVKYLQTNRNEIHELKLALQAKDEEIRTTKQSHSQVKAQLASENQRLIKLNHQLLLANVELKEDVEVFRLQAKEAEGKAKRLAGRLSNADTETELARDRALEVSNELEEAQQQLKKTRDESRNLCLTSGRNIMDKDKQIRKLEQQLTKLEEQTQQNSREGIPEEKLKATEKTSADEFKKIAGLEKQPAEQFEDHFGELFKVEDEISLLKSDMDTTKAALKEKTDELPSAIEQHPKERQKAEETREKCRCKDKESYLESVEEHVENLRGTLEDVLSKDRGAYSVGAEQHDGNLRESMEKALKHVSIYQGRKRRRTEGPDFEY
ncbi:hypothetical protein CcaCcLH18_05715 [Colletotrichum camelliae]|nr:hypothetical protein CcaCcLH18_05715 [Colletotrichum camelliae]